MSGTEHVLVTGGAGFIGSNLAARLAAEGRSVTILDSLVRIGSEQNARELTARWPGRIRVLVGDIRDTGFMAGALADADAVVHLAAQVAVTTSVEDPLTDFEVNCAATVRLLDLIRRGGRDLSFVFASSNKVYGDLADVPLARTGAGWQPQSAPLARSGIDEDQPLALRTPYGCSKGAADQYVLDYAAQFGLAASVLRMSCIYGPRQRGSEEQGWIGHFLQSVATGRAVTLYGDGYQVRDVLFVDDAVSAYIAAIDAAGAQAGRVYNLGGGPDNAVFLLQVLEELGRLAGRPPRIAKLDWRPGDQRWFVADSRRARAALGLGSPLPWRQGLAQMHGWYRDAGALARAPERTVA